MFDPTNQQIMKKSNENFKWFVSHYDELKDKFRGKFIAIDDNKIVDSDIHQENLLTKLTNMYGDIRHIFIYYISEKDYVSMI